jgi:Fe-S cluster assembly iron-binding protein IscA
MNYVKPSDASLVAKDEVVEMHGVRVFVDPKATFFVVGTTMDYEVRDVLQCIALISISREIGVALGE